MTSNIDQATDRPVPADGDKTHWTVLTANDAYSMDKPYVAKAGEHVRSVGSYVDAQFGSVVIGEKGGNIVAEAGSDVTVLNRSSADARAGSRTTAADQGMVSADSDAKVTVKQGGWASVHKGAFAEVEAGGEAHVDAAGQAHAQAGSVLHVEKGGKASADSGAQVILDFGATVDAAKGTDVQTKAEVGDERIINSGSVTNLSDASWDSEISLRNGVTVEPGAKLSLGEGSIAQALPNSDVTARDGSIVLAESGSHVIAEPGAKIIAKEGAQVEDRRGAIIAKADQEVDFGGLLTFGFRERGIDFKPGSHFVGDHQKADSDRDIIPPNAKQVQVFGDHNWRVPDGASVVAMPGSKIIAAAGAVDAMSGSHVEAYRDSYVTAEKGSDVVAYNQARVDAQEGSNVDARNGSHIRADKGANILRHVETDMQEDRGANITWKPTAMQRVQYEAEKLGWKIAPAAVFLLSGGMSTLRDSAHYRGPTQRDYKDNFPDW